MSEILENAADSLQVGVQFYLDKQKKYSRKYAILIIFHGVQLFLKEALHRIHPLLIYRKIDEPISDDSQTVGLKEILARFDNLGIELTRNDRSILRNLQRRRNTIEHHRFVDDESHFFVVGKALKFLYDFLPHHLGTSLEDMLREDVYRQVRDLILSYEERLSEAQDEVSARTTPRSKDDLAGMPQNAECPECGTRTMVIGAEQGDFCFLCRQPYKMMRCDYCGEYFAADDLGLSCMCDDCERSRLDRW